MSAEWESNLHCGRKTLPLIYLTDGYISRTYKDLKNEGIQMPQKHWDFKSFHSGWQLARKEMKVNASKVK